MLDELFINENKVFIALLTAGFALLTSILTAFFNKVVDWFFKNSDFTRDYYKKIIDKRIEAYEEIEEMINVFNKVIKPSESNNGYPVIFKDHVSLIEFNDKLNISISHSLWISNDLESKLNKLQQFLYEEIISHGLNTETEDIHYQNLGNALYDKIALWYIDINKLMFKEWTTLHRVKQFLKQKNLGNH